MIVSSADKGKDSLAELLKNNTFTQITTASCGAEARRSLIGSNYDLVVINTPLMDEFGHELAVMISGKTSSGVILFVKSELADEVSARVEDYGIFVLSKPVNRQIFYQALKLLAAAERKLRGLKSENIQLQGRIEEMRLIDRAKCALIQYLNMTEPQAHRYLEKQAMDMRVTRNEIARSILKTYES